MRESPSKEQRRKPHREAEREPVNTVAHYIILSLY